jgi:hypothetical protein
MKKIDLPIATAAEEIALKTELASSKLVADR